MKKSYVVYGILWAIALGLFNAVVFLVPHEINGVYRLTGVFWVSYAFVSVAFVGQLLCGILALKPKNITSVLYRVPLIRISYGGVIIMAVFSTVFMAVPKAPAWLGAVVCAAVLAFTAASLIKAGAVAVIADETDKKTAARTRFMDTLEAKARALEAKATTPELKDACKVLVEEITYSDKTSSPELESADKSLEAQLKLFAEAVEADDRELALENSKSFLSVLKERNSLCKQLK